MSAQSGPVAPGTPAWPDGPALGDGGARPAPAAILTVTGGTRLGGRVRVPGDKSVSHRALLLGAAAPGTTVVHGLSDGDDVRRMALAVRAMGAAVEVVGDDVHVRGGDLHEAASPLDLGNSGTAIRLLVGFVAAYPWFTVLHGDASIAARPMDRVVAPLREMGARIDGREGGRLAPLAVRGGDLRGIDYAMPVASAQVKSGLLLAGLRATGSTTVREPAPCRAHTEEMLRAAGAELRVSASGAIVTVGASTLQPSHIAVPGDPSQAAYWVVAGCIVPGSDVVIEDVYVGRARRGFLDVLARMGARIEITPRSATTADIRARYGPLIATDVRGEEVPGLIDEIPALAIAAACARGATTFADAREFRVKESDRIVTTAAALRSLGVDVEELDDGLRIEGVAEFRDATIDPWGDHRVAMAAAVAGMRSSTMTTIEGWHAVATSYPGFEADLDSLRR